MLPWESVFLKSQTWFFLEVTFIGMAEINRMQTRVLPWASWRLWRAQQPGFQVSSVGAGHPTSWAILCCLSETQLRSELGPKADCLWDVLGVPGSVGVRRLTICTLGWAFTYLETILCSNTWSHRLLWMKENIMFNPNKFQLYQVIRRKRHSRSTIWRKLRIAFVSVNVLSILRSGQEHKKRILVDHLKASRSIQQQEQQPLHKRRLGQLW